MVFKTLATPFPPNTPNYAGQNHLPHCCKRKPKCPLTMVKKVTHGIPTFLTHTTSINHYNIPLP